MNIANKVEIELRVVQFWFEIKHVIRNRRNRFEITRLISDQIALHSIQNYYYKSSFSYHVFPPMVQLLYYTYIWPYNVDAEYYYSHHK